MKQLGKYRIIELIGSGTYAEVYRAEDPLLRRIVALKVLKGALLSDQEAVDRFLQEAQTAAHLIHPQIAWVWDLGEVEGRYFLAMRYVAGPSLARLLQERGRLPWPEAWGYLSQISDALVFAHARGLVHRDIKPQNIMVGPTDGAVLTDFGLVRAMEAGSIGTRTGALMGTPAYIAPEIWQGQPAGPAADQYSLACVLMELLTGRKLFDGPTPPAVMRQHLMEGPHLPEHWPADCPEELGGLIAKALAQDPGDRFADLAAFQAALQLASDAPPPPAAPAAVGESGPASRSDAAPQPGQVWNLEDGLTALKEMEAEQEWQLAAELLTELEASYPDHPRLKLSHKRITQALEKKQQADELARSAAVEKQKREAAERTRRAAQYQAGQAAPNLAPPQNPEIADLPAARRSGADPILVRLAQNLEMEFVPVQAGDFLMGSDPARDPGTYPDEQPQHRVPLPDYWIGRTPVTNAQYAAFVLARGGTAPKFWHGNQPPGQKRDHPVVQISWNEAAAFCEWMCHLTGWQVRLPTEAEWEKAARGTDGRIYPWGDQEPDAMHCNFANRFGTTTPAILYTPIGLSPYGCCDMAGNVWEWCADWYAGDYYNQYFEAQSPSSGPAGPLGPDTGKDRVARGGSWVDEARHMRTATRFKVSPGSRTEYLGFRCVLKLKP
ncbi:MAG TPA: bifunctional serine/threonine-protein kinase/formylglycine-generating enzyme family protein [Anaerolineaceae bacterium]|nr:bifunctional serine/threonine-protein kinase/formylglycine-generating enzyme family protein [Anaerolineaceae bacterium]